MQFWPSRWWRSWRILGFASVPLLVSEPSRRERQETSAAISLPIVEIWPWRQSRSWRSPRQYSATGYGVAIAGCAGHAAGPFYCQAGAALGDGARDDRRAGGVLRFLTWKPERLLRAGALLAALAMLLGSCAAAMRRSWRARAVRCRARPHAARAISRRSACAPVAMRRARPPGVNAIGQGLGRHGRSGRSGRAAPPGGAAGPVCLRRVLLALAFCLRRRVTVSRACNDTGGRVTGFDSEARGNS